jgi:ATP-dependent Clp protease ATP-binding subunit ClpA
MSSPRAARRSPAPTCSSPIFAERESHAAYFLQEQDMTRYDAVNYIAHGIAKRPAPPSEAGRCAAPTRARAAARRPTRATSRQGQEEGSALDAYCVNLNRKARDGKHRSADRPRGRGRAHHPDPLPPQKNNPLLVGDPGVGKTAIAEGLARKIITRRGARGAGGRDHLLARHGHAAGRHPLSRRFRGTLKQVVKEIEAHPKAILFIDEIHTVIGAGATSGGAMDASNLLKPALASGTLRCIGSTTYKEYRQYFEKDRALVRRFQKIDVNEPTMADTIEILKGLKPYYEEFHKLRYTNDAIKAAVELSARYITDRKLPDKAIDVIDETGASQMLVPETAARRSSASRRSRP